MANATPSTPVTPVALTRRSVSAIAKLDFARLSHSQRLEAIAGALGYATAAALMTTLKTTEAAPSGAITPAAPSGAPIQVIVAFGQGYASAVGDSRPVNPDYDTGTFEQRSFATSGEATAYEQGLADADGWMESLVVERSDRHDAPYLTAVAAGETRTFATWFNEVGAMFSDDMLEDDENQD